MITRVYSWFIRLVLGILMVPASAFALPTRHDLPVVARVEEGVAHDRVHLRIGRDTRIETVTAVVNGFVRVGSQLTRDEIAAQLGRHAIRVCEATAITPRTINRDPDHFSTCPQARHDYWLPDYERGIAVDVVHQPTTDEVLVRTLEENARLVDEKVRLEAALAASEASHPMIQIVPDPADATRIRRLRAELVAHDLVIENGRFWWLRLKIAFLFALGAILWLAVIVYRKNRALVKERLAAETEREEREEDRQTECGALRESITTLTNTNLTLKSELAHATSERQALQQTLQAKKEEPVALQALAESESMKDLHRQLVEARTQIESLGSQLAHARSDNLLEQLEELSEQHTSLILYSKGLETEALKDSATIRSLLDQLAEKDQLLIQLQAAPIVG